MRDESRWRMMKCRIPNCMSCYMQVTCQVTYPITCQPWLHAKSHAELHIKLQNSNFRGDGGISTGNCTKNMQSYLYFRDNFSDEKTPYFNSVSKIIKNLRDFPNDSQTPHTPCSSPQLCVNILFRLKDY